MDLKINVSKMKIVIFGEGNVDFDCHLNDERVEIVNEFVYLGRVFEKSGSMDGEINRRVYAGRKVVGTMAKLTRSKRLSHKAKLAVYNAVLLPTLLHGSECWVCLEKHRSKLNAVGMSFLRAMCGKNRFDRNRVATRPVFCGTVPHFHQMSRIPQTVEMSRNFYISC
jgi:hypothetical protein